MIRDWSSVKQAKPLPHGHQPGLQPYGQAGDLTHSGYISSEGRIQEAPGELKPARKPTIHLISVPRLQKHRKDLDPGGVEGNGGLLANLRIGPLSTGNPWQHGDEGMGKVNRERLQRGMRKILRVMDMFIILIVLIFLWCIHISKFITYCTLNICSLLYVSYTISIHVLSC